MEQLYQSIIIILFSIILVFAKVTNTQQEISNYSENCTLHNNQQGFCTQRKDCEYVNKLIIRREYNKVKMCKERVVCCPRPEKIQSPPPEYPKSEKFQKALCLDKISVPPIALNIIGGERVNVGEFAFHVSLGYKLNNKIEYLCGGSLIADDIVITAAHCVNSRQYLPITVKLGKASLVEDDYDFGDGEDIGIQIIKIHPNYLRRNRTNDIAIVKLQRPTNFSCTIKTVCLSSFADFELPRNLTILGYGRSYMNIVKSSNWLLKSIVSKYSLDECEDYMNQIGRKLANDQICTVGLKSCHGDSGSPLTYKYKNIDYIHGIMSYRTGCELDNPAVYIKVNEHLHWIDNEMFKFENPQ